MLMGDGGKLTGREDLVRLKITMSLLNRHFWKFFAGLLGLVALGFLVIFGTSFYAQKKAYEAKTFESESQPANP